jgi:hypothetical protein
LEDFMKEKKAISLSGRKAECEFCKHV